MFNIYDRYSLAFNDGEKIFNFDIIQEIQDFDDYIIIKTPVTIGDIKRGWVGDITFNLSGFNMEKGFSDEERVGVLLHQAVGLLRYDRGDDDIARISYSAHFASSLVLSAALMKAFSASTENTTSSAFRTS